MSDKDYTTENQKAFPHDDPKYYRADGTPTYYDPEIDYDSLFYHDPKPVPDDVLFAMYKRTGEKPEDIVQADRRKAYEAYLEAHKDDA